LALAGPGTLVVAIVFVILASSFFGSGENLIAAFLPELARSQSLGKISGWGWSLGYLGGLFVLGLCLAYITFAQARGDEASQFVPVTMWITAGMFALASLPTFVFLRERAQPQMSSSNGVWRQAFTRLGHTLHVARQYTDMQRFLICIVFYQAGIQAVIGLAAIYAQQAMKFSTQDTIAMIFVVNITAAIGAFAFGYVQDRLGHVKTIALTLAGWIIMVGLAWAAEGPAMFWVAANVAGISLGSSQSAGRALVGALSPPSRRAEFYGLWGLAVKMSSILGPMTYGLVTWLTGGDHRLAILITGSYFVIGLILLSGIDVERGRKAALAE
jgi:UMF1 family MFS transporter